jgi:hypothetical protein
MTKGESRVRVAFNPDSNDKVTQIKVSAALLIDLIEDLKLGNPDELQPAEKSSEFFRLKALAQTAVEEAAMWAVKAATI